MGNKSDDQLAGVLQDTDVPRGSSVTVVAYSKLQPRPTTAVGSQTADFTPQTMTESSTSVSVDFYNDGLNTMGPYKPYLKFANPAIGNAY